MAAPSQPTGGIPDPDQPGLWLVCPWPTTASFREVVRHFVRAYFWQLEGDTSAARQLAYFKGYQAALAAASTHELTYAASWRWHDELMRWIDICIAQFSSKRGAELPWSRVDSLQAVDGVQPVLLTGPVGVRA
ncbi:MAG TPA: hypothetical protein VFX16_24895 [Pseudonocardiaceae bacterium]|nr:hypothetical protein [Pseudonocardiaceae bacterium]